MYYVSKRSSPAAAPGEALFGRLSFRLQPYCCVEGVMSQNSFASESSQAARPSVIGRSGCRKEQPMQSEECGCTQATSVNELCRAEDEEYLRVMELLRKSVAASEPKEGKHADAA